MFMILSETMMTASRVDGFRYTEGTSARPNRMDLRDSELLRRVRAARDGLEATRQPL